MSVYEPSAMPGASPASYAQYPDDMPTPSVSLTPLVNSAGALISLALIAGLGVWGYNLAMRDVSGVPVVRAQEGPMRIQPDNPGGQQTDHQGLAVNRVQADGVAEPTANTITLAPRPLDLSDVTPAVVTEALAAPEAATPVPVAAVAPARDPAAAAQALIEELAAANATAQDPEATRPDIVAASVPGVSRSPRPTLRPAALKVSPAPQPVAAPASDVAFVDPASIVAGTRLVQLGAFDSAEEAKAAWAGVSGRYAAYIEGIAPVVQPATSGGRSFHRLRATGFADLAEARQLCAVLEADNVTCVPVMAR